VLLPALLALLGSSSVLASDPAEPVAPPVLVCTPTTFQQRGKGPETVQNPIARALSEATPGSTVWLQPGDYPAFTIGFQTSSPANAKTEGGQPGFPIVVQGTAPGVRILGGEGDAIAIDQKVPCAWITFKSLTIVPGRRSGVIFYQRGDGRVHQGFHFEDVHILGRYDHTTGEGPRSKWGVWGQNLADFRFAGVDEPARIENISEEHAFYLQNSQGPIVIENVHARDLGRTFLQLTARPQNGPVGIGDVTVRDCHVEDACIARADGFKGGSAFSVCGRMTGILLFERNVYRAGFRIERLPLTMPAQPYGTGAFTAWEEGKSGRNGTLILRDNDFAFAEGCGDRPVVSIGGCDRVLIVGQNRFVSGGRQPALSLDPASWDGKPVSTPNGSAYVAPATQIEGELVLRNRAPSPEELAQLRREAPEGGSTPPGER
jgi:hypothetical protein